MSMQVFETPVGGVMTVEVGAITGEVVAFKEQQGDLGRITIAYRGSDDRYTVQGSPVSKDIPLSRIVEHLAADPGVGADDNPMATDLAALR